MKEIYKDSIESILVILTSISGGIKVITLSDKKIISNFVDNKGVTLSNVPLDGIAPKTNTFLLDQAEKHLLGEGEGNLIEIPWKKNNYFCFGNLCFLDSEGEWVPYENYSENILESVFSSNDWPIDKFSGTLECSLLTENMSPVYSKMDSSGVAHQFRENVCESLKRMGVYLKGHYSGEAEGQQVFDLGDFECPILLSEEIILLKLVSVHCATKMKLFCSFAPKLFPEKGNGLRIKFSFKEEADIFQFANNVVESIDGIVGVSNPSSNSFKRFEDINFGYIKCWSTFSNTSCVRIDNQLMTFNFIDAIVNPYLIIAMILYISKIDGKNNWGSESINNKRRIGSLNSNGCIKYLTDVVKSSYLVDYFNSLVKEERKKIFNYISEEEKVSLVRKF